MKISKEVREILNESIMKVKENKLVLPRPDLRKESDVNRVVSLFGGRWDYDDKCYYFKNENWYNELSDALME